MTSFEKLWRPGPAKPKTHPVPGSDSARGGKFLYLLVLCPLAALLFLFGGARPWIWQGVTGLFFLCLGAWNFRFGVSPPDKRLRGLLIIGLCFLLVPLTQIIPLPLALLEILSPVRGQWARTLLELGNISSTTISYEPLATWMRLAWWLFLLTFAVLLAQALNSGQTKYPVWLLHSIFVLAGLEAIYGILQALLPGLGVLWNMDPQTGLAYKGSARGTFINRNHYAAFLGLLWPVLLAYVLILKSPRKMEHALGKRAQAQVLVQQKAFAVFCLALIILGLVLSQSRGGILGALLSFTLLYLFAGLRQKRVAAALATCWIIVLGYGTIIGFDDISNRFSQIGQDATGRVEIWKDAWNAARDHPLTGTGLGTYPSVGRAYQNAFSPQLRAHHAHNDYLEAVVEMGLPAAGILILGIWALWCRRAFFLWRKRQTMNPDRLVLAAGSLAALGGYILHSGVEFNNAIPANQLTAVMVAIFHIHISREMTDQPGQTV